AFLPQPRASIQTALGQPEIYLNCECCHPPTDASSMSLSDLVLPTQHDTCILYKLYVECGRMINMFDWFTAFGMILERGVEGSKVDDDDNDNESNRSKKRPKTRRKNIKIKKETDNPDEGKKLDQKEVQARFIAGVAELQFMGFIKSTNRKTDHVQRLTWGNI
ncbi:Origin recognition complex subunit 3, partial [Entomortierella beljakovae]